MLTMITVQTNFVNVCVSVNIVIHKYLNFRVNLSYTSCNVLVYFPLVGDFFPKVNCNKQKKGLFPWGEANAVHHSYITFLWCHMNDMTSQITGNWAILNSLVSITVNKNQCYASLALCEWNPSVTGRFPHKGTSMRTVRPRHGVVLK